MEHPATRLYRARKAQGLCPMCGKERDDADKTICSACREYRRENYRLTMERLQPAAKKALLIRKSRTQYQRTLKRREQGLCVRCGAESPEHWLCETCNEKLKEWKKSRAD